jgi:hypothetical protein
VPLEAVLVEVTIKGESMIEPMIVDQSETSAIDEAEVFVIISNENQLRRLFNRLANAKNFDAGERLHEFGGSMTDFEADQVSERTKFEVKSWALAWSNSVYVDVAAE